MQAQPDVRVESAQEEETRLWVRWREQRDPVVRADLVERYLWLAKVIAHQVFRERARAVDLRDMIQSATLGLLEAIDRYDPGRGVQFRHYASKRIRGAIIDSVDQSSDYQAQIAAARGLLRERAHSLQESDGGSENDRFRRMVGLTVGLAIGLLLEESTLDDGGRTDGPYASTEAAILGQQLRNLVAALPQQERLVMRYHYFNELPFREIAGLMQLTPARISQIHRSALKRLRMAHGKIGRMDMNA